MTPSVLRLLLKALSATSKLILPNRAYLYLKRATAPLREWVIPDQLMMSCRLKSGFPDLVLPDGVSIHSFKDKPDLSAWVTIVNGPLGQWDLSAAEYLFFRDRYFLPELCLFLCNRNRVVATATGRVRTIAAAPCGEIHMVAVREDSRGQNFGYLVSLAVLYKLAELKVHKIVLRTDRWRLPAIRTYLRLGFRPIYRVSGRDHSDIWSSILPRVSDINLEPETDSGGGGGR